MNKVNKTTHQRRKNYFYITEDEPINTLPKLRTTGMQVKLPKPTSFFFIDFMNCIFLNSRVQPSNDDTSGKSRQRVCTTIKFIEIRAQYHNQYRR
ncbi:MAG: hypothetical protein KDD45_08255 [Bdellovibrionales bacterium]|nr:hypothetical protein [Bdellovibrionales bacterium]